MPWLIGKVADQAGLAAGMAVNLVPCVGLLVLEDWPDARIEVLDSGAATVSEALMVENAAALRLSLIHI